MQIYACFIILLGITKTKKKGNESLLPSPYKEEEKINAILIFNSGINIKALTKIKTIVHG